MAKEEDAELGNEGAVKAAIRSTKKSMRPSKIGEPERHLIKSSKTKEKKSRRKSGLGKGGVFDRDMGDKSRHEGARAKKGDVIGGMGKKKGPKRKIK
jgi:ATP-dependent RNA helicase DDX27